MTRRVIFPLLALALSVAMPKAQGGMVPDRAVNRVVAPGGSEPAGRGSEVDSLFFIDDGNDVDEESMKHLIKHAALLKANTRLIVTLTAYTAHLGSQSYGLAVADEVLNSVTGILRSLGIPPRQIRRSRHGVGRLGSECGEATCADVQRRVDLSYD